MLWYADSDGDLYGDPSSSNLCERAVSTDVTDNNDCDDTDPDEYPGVLWYADSAGDLYGDPSSSNSCERAVSTDVADNNGRDYTSPDA